MSVKSWGGLWITDNKLFVCTCEPGHLQVSSRTTSIRLIRFFTILGIKYKYNEKRQLIVWWWSYLCTLSSFNSNEEFPQSSPVFLFYSSHNFSKWETGARCCWRGGASDKRITYVFSGMKRFFVSKQRRVFWTFSTFSGLTISLLSSTSSVQPLNSNSSLHLQMTLTHFSFQFVLNVSSRLVMLLKVGRFNVPGSFLL